MNTIALMSPFRQRPGFIKRLYYRLRNAGIDGVQDEEAVQRITLINTICLAIGVIIFGFIFISYFLTKSWELPLIVAIEFVLNAGVLVLNFYRKYRAAALLMYFLQCVAIVFYGYILGSVIQLQFMIIFLISIIYLFFKEENLRKICFAAAICTLVFMEISYYYNKVQQPVTLSYDASYLIQALAIGGVLGLIIIVSKPYIRSKDINAELKRANHFKRIFIFQVTHELRTPMNAIYGVAQLMKREIKLDPALKPMEELTDHLMLATNNARQVINGVLDIAQIEAGIQEKMTEEAFFVRPYFAGIMEINRVIGRARNLRLECHIDDKIPEVLMGDTLKLTQVLTNLLANAIKYSNKRSLVQLNVLYDDAQWRIQVLNEGRHITPEMQKDIFNPFITMRDRHTEGTGLGLYLVMNKVNAMSGRINVESNAGGNIVFEVILPLQPARPEDVLQADEDSLANDLSDIKIILAEDNELNALLLSKYLNDIGCHLTLTENGREVMDQVAKRMPDLIIMDYHMEVMDGKETLIQLKNDPALKHIPVIIVTGDAFVESREALLAAGANAVIEKPINYNTLLKVLKQQLHHGSEELQE